MKTIGIIAALIGALIAARPVAAQGKTEEERLGRACVSEPCVDEDKQRKQCGKDFQRLDLGMQIQRVSKCTFPARLVGASETPNGRIYFYLMSRTRITTDAKGRIIQVFQ